MTEETVSPSFKSNLTLSAALHVGVLAFFTIKAYWFPSEPIVIQQAIRVDMVALPDKATTATTKAPSKTEAPVPVAPAKVEQDDKNATKPEATETSKPKTSKQIRDEAMKRMQAIEKLRKQMESQQSSNQVENLKDKLSAVAERTFKGNVVSEGTSSTGTAQIQRDQYAGQIGTHIKRSWFLPKWLEDAKLSAEVRIKIDDRGFVIAKQLVRASGDQTFDGLVLNTVEKASPLPPPPKELVNFYEHQGITLLFP